MEAPGSSCGAKQMFIGKDTSGNTILPAATTAAETGGARMNTLSQMHLRVTGVLRKVFSFHLFLAALLLAGAYIGTFTNVHQALSPTSQPLRWVESDTLWHVTVGTLILKTHIWPTHDTYSF